MEEELRLKKNFFTSQYKDPEGLKVSPLFHGSPKGKIS